MFNFDVKLFFFWFIVICDVFGVVNVVVVCKVLCSVYFMLFELYFRKCVRMNRFINSLFGYSCSDC